MTPRYEILETIYFFLGQCNSFKSRMQLHSAKLMLETHVLQDNSLLSS